MNFIDIIVVAIILFYAVAGIRKGFARTLIGPVALILGTFIAFVYYQKTEDFLWALLISILAPLTVNLSLLIVLKILHKTLGANKKPSLSSRLSGAALAILWSGTWIILTLIFLVITPCEWGWFDNLQDEVLGSRTYKAINKIVGDKIPDTSMNVNKISEMLQNPRKFTALRKTDEYKGLVENEKVRDLLGDKETMKQIENQNIPKLLSNPKFQALIQDKDLIKKVFQLHQKLLELEKQKEI